MFAALRTPRLPAFTAALRLILKPFFGEELLLARGENELSATVLTGQHLVFHRDGLQSSSSVKAR